MFVNKKGRFLNCLFGSVYYFRPRIFKVRKIREKLFFKVVCAAKSVRVKSARVYCVRVRGCARVLRNIASYAMKLGACDHLYNITN